MSYLGKAIADKHAILDETGKRPRITYVAVNRTDYFDDPEEKVRAEFWAELIYSYAYPPQRLGIEVTIPDRLPTDRADIVIFRDDDRKRPYAIIECKKAEVTDAEYQQAIEQAFGNGTWAKLRADYVAVVAGLTRTVYDFSDRYGALERDGNIIADLPRAYGKAPEWRFTKGGGRDIAPVSPYELRSILKKCHDTLWGGGRLSPTAAFGELCKIVFVKIHDEKANRRVGEPYHFQIRTHEASASLTSRIKELYQQHRLRDPEVFNEDIRVGDETLSLVVRHLEGCNLNKTDLDVKGQAFQKFMSGFFKGDAGQFYTPTPLVRFAVRMMEPKNDERVIDPACGSGGFLLEALDYVRTKADEYHDKATTDHFRHWHDFAQNNLFGIALVSGKFKVCLGYLSG